VLTLPLQSASEIRRIRPERSQNLANNKSIDEFEETSGNVSLLQSGPFIRLENDTEKAVAENLHIQTKRFSSFTPSQLV